MKLHKVFTHFLQFYRPTDKDALSELSASAGW